MALIFSSEENNILNQIKKEYELTDQMVEYIKTYIQQLCAWNEYINLTAISDIKNILLYHIQDSLHITKFIDFSSVTTMVDVGSGAGLPGIPLKIMFPHLNVILIEVTKKRIEFLVHIINTLDIENIDIYPHDWRTFLRKTDFAVELFCARASLTPEELIRMFKPSCVYNEAQLVYWASGKWQSGKKEMPYIKEQIFYTIKSRRRQFVFFEKTVKETV